MPGEANMRGRQTNQACVRITDTIQLENREETLEHSAFDLAVPI
ncbi:MAG: hypothetical protein ACP5MD_09690 [Verrucomicrobiia bacterium]